MNLYMPWDDAEDMPVETGEEYMSSSPRKASINSSTEGWTSRPDFGKSNASPVGDPHPLFFILLAGIYLFFNHKKSTKNKQHTEESSSMTNHLSHRSRRGVSLFLFLFPVIAPSEGAFLSSLSASGSTITSLSLDKTCSRPAQTITVIPTISTEESPITLCWGLYHDAACTHPVSDITFSASDPSIPYAVSFTAPVQTGTYYIRTSLHSGSSCHYTLAHSLTQKIDVYPSDADIIISRSHQEAAEQINISSSMPENKKVYGVLHFNKRTLSDESLSLFQRYNYFVSFPFDVRAGEIFGFGEIGTHWRILFYDGLTRAQQGFFAEDTDNWVMIDDTDSILHAYQGYLLQLNYLSLESTSPIWGDKDQLQLFFPALQTITSITHENETIPALGPSYQCTINRYSTLGEEGDRRIKDSYWRCIGTPSLDIYNGDAAEGDPFHWQTENLPYLYQWDMTDNSLQVVSTDGFDFLPTHAYLTQTPEAIVWKNVSKPVPSHIAAERKSSVPFDEFRLDLILNDSLLDQTFIRMTDDERVSSAFDFGLDLSKEQTDGNAIYSQIGYERVAANCLPFSSERTLIPLGISLAKDENYTFALVLSSSSEEDLCVTLIDTVRQIRTELTGESSYTTELKAGKVEGRFFVEISPAAHSTTDLEEKEREYTPCIKILDKGVVYLKYKGRKYKIN